jgi:glycosyltransferase involved in cell wall biosynthesis
MVKISICIPTTELVYSNGQIMGPYMLGHLLKSISNQTFTDYEIIISDQSKSDIIKDECNNWKDLNIKYYKNTYGLGSAAKNLNFAFTKSMGEYIKPIFQDDFFYSPNTLEYIVSNLGDNNWGFVGTYHCNENEINNLYRPFSPVWDDPIKILSGKNTVSGPSVMFFKNENNLFDEDLCWLNDVEFYYRLYLKYGLPILLPRQEIVQRLRIEGVSNTLTSDIKNEECFYVLCKHNINKGSKNVEDYPNMIKRINQINYENY